MSNAPLSGLAGIAVGIVIGSAVIMALSSPPVTIRVASLQDADTEGAVIDAPNAVVTGIWAWTNGDGAAVAFGSLDCLWGVSGAHDNDLLLVGQHVHLLASGRVSKNSASFTHCRLVSDK
jgi:hypothetical protein